MSRLKVEGDPMAILKLAYGGQMPSGGSGQPLEEGGEVEGPSHEEGGVPVENAAGEQIAEVEGGERVFSIEDTEMIEQAAEQIIEMQSSGDQAGAEDMAMRLGFAVVDMIARQEQNQSAQEQQMMQQAQASGASQPMAPGGAPGADAEMMNSFGGV
jgi:hypothetical protein